MKNQGNINISHFVLTDLGILAFDCPICKQIFSSETTLPMKPNLTRMMYIMMSKKFSFHFDQTKNMACF